MSCKRLLFLVLLALPWSACIHYPKPPETTAEAGTPTDTLTAAEAKMSAGTPAAEGAGTARAPDYLTIAAVGDNLIHKEIYQAVYRNRAYHFDPVYETIKPLIQAADIAFVNQETMLAGEEFGYSSYPRFNTPGEAGRALVNAGFDVINHANNHVMDMGERGVAATIRYWEQYPDITVLGVFPSQERRDEKRVIEKNNIRVGFLSYTTGTNGIPVPRDKPYLVSLADREIMAGEIDALRPLCDFLVVSMHWGDEYRITENEAQREYGRFLAEHRVDLVLGHHPHVLQPWARIPRPDGGETICFYSLGNFMSAQERPETLLGGMAYIKLRKDVVPGTPAASIRAAVSVEEAGLMPLVTHNEPGPAGFRVYPLHDYPAELAAAHRIKKISDEISVDYFKDLAKRAVDGSRGTDAGGRAASGLINYNPFSPD
ncbi:MAG: CapA family protein [Treponema sp.]|nr:CapA family protein [Treponema sp.]